MTHEYVVVAARRQGPRNRGGQDNKSQLISSIGTTVCSTDLGAYLELEYRLRVQRNQPGTRATSWTSSSVSQVDGPHGMAKVASVASTRIVSQVRPVRRDHTMPCDRGTASR